MFIGLNVKFYEENKSKRRKKKERTGEEINCKANDNFVCKRSGMERALQFHTPISSDMQINAVNMWLYAFNSWRNSVISRVCLV